MHFSRENMREKSMLRLLFSSCKFLKNNQFVTNQVIINSKAKSSKIIDRTMNIQFNAEVDSALSWDFKVLQNFIDIKLGQNKIVKYEGKNISNKVRFTVLARFNKINSKDFYLYRKSKIYQNLSTNKKVQTAIYQHN